MAIAVLCLRCNEKRECSACGERLSPGTGARVWKCGSCGGPYELDRCFQCGTSVFSEIHTPVAHDACTASARCHRCGGARPAESHEIDVGDAQPRADPDLANLDAGTLGPSDLENVRRFIDMFNDGDRINTAEHWNMTGSVGVLAYEARQSMPVSFEKMLVLQVSACGLNLWEDFMRADDAERYLEWAVNRSEKHGWTSSDTQMGAQYDYCRATLAEIGRTRLM